MERREKRRGKLGLKSRKAAIAAALAVIAVGAAPSAEAGVSWFYKFVCEDMFHYFDHSVKRADKAIEKFGWARKGFLELGTERLPGGYGLLLRQNYENYFRECEDVLKKVAAMAKRATNNEQAELVRTKLAELKSNVFSPDEVDGTMDWVIKKMSKVPDADLSKYEKMKADYRIFYARLSGLNFDDTRAEFAQFLVINESAFEAHLAGLIAAGKPFEGVVDLSFGELKSGMPNRNPVYLQFLEMNVELIREGGKGMQGELAARSYMMEKWSGAIATELAAGNPEVLPNAAKALVYESLKLMAMGRMTGVGRELNLSDIYAMTKRLRSGFLTKGEVAKLRPEEISGIAKTLDDYAAALENYPVYDEYRYLGLPAAMRELANGFRNPRVVR